MESVDKVFTNIDLLKLIFQHLDFGDQIRLAHVNHQLRYAFQVLSGNVNYRSLRIFKDTPIGGFADEIYVAGGMGANRKYLQSEQELEDFLELYADTVRDLTLWNCETCSWETIVRKLSKLRSISTYKMDRYINEISNAIYPAELEELHIIRITELYYTYDKIGENMKNLRKLQIVNTAANADLKLEFLKIQVHSCTIDASFDGTRNLKQVHILLTQVEDFQKLPLNNLRVLHLSTKGVANELFPILTENCPNLEDLTLTYVKFVNLRTLSLPPKLTKLSFHTCNGITHSCLKHILSELSIIKFCSRATPYIGKFNHFEISSQIQSLEIDFVEITELRSTFENSNQLKELTLYPFHMEKEPYHIFFDGPPNLQRLDIPYTSAAIGALTKLKSLRSLQLTHWKGILKWCDIVDVLKHPTLNELSIYSIYTASASHFQPSELHGLPMMSLQTNITWLTITPTVLRPWMKFWLKLFTTNIKMTLVCCSLDKFHQLRLVKELVHHENFPRKLKTIDVCCCTIDCKLLRQNFDAVTHNIPAVDNDLIWDQDTVCKNLKMTMPSRIVLSWQHNYNF